MIKTAILITTTLLHLSNAEVYNYGAGTGAAAGTGGGYYTQPPIGGGSSWTYAPSWSTGSAGLSGGGSAYSGNGFSSQWASWSTPQSSASNANNGGALSSFTRQNGNCQGNYLGAVLPCSLEECASSCLSSSSCAGFSYNLQSSIPQCILKSAACSSPDPTATFTFFCRSGFSASAQPSTGHYHYAAFPSPPHHNHYPYHMHYIPPIYHSYPYMMHRMGSYPSYGHGHYDVHYADEPYEHDPFWKSASVRQFKKPGQTVSAQYLELPANCSGPIMRGPYKVTIDTCAEDCSAQKPCTGFSYDNATDSCILHTGICHIMQQSKQWSYFARSGRLQADEIVRAALEAKMKTEAAIREATLMDSLPLTTVTKTLTTNQPSTQPPKKGFQYNPSPTPANDVMSRFEQLNGNCPGNAIGPETAVSLDECARLCVEDFKCAGFTYNLRARKPEQYQCMLKNKSCNEPSVNSPYRFFRRRSFTGFTVPRPRVV